MAIIASGLARTARDALSKGDLNGCAQTAARLIERTPTEPEGHFLFAMALTEGGRIAAALQSAEKAVALAPSNAEYAAQYARILTLARQEAAARTAADTAASLAKDDDPLTLDTIGCVYARLSDHAAALPLFERVVTLEPDNVGYRFNLATSYGFFGRVVDAEAQYEAIIALAPDHGRAHLGIAALRRQTSESNHADRLETALAQTADPTERLRIHYAAAKEYEDLGNHEAVFRHLSTGNAAHKAANSLSVESDARNIHAIQSCFGRPDYFRGASDVPDGPIFVTGLPRTGTTLVDRILSSHPDLSSAGELQAMPLAIKRLSQSGSRLVLDPDTILRAGELAPAQVGIAYLQRARQHAGADRPVFVDKLPLNFLYIGYIARALPNAKIVCLRRHPMDSVWSNFKNLFATTSSYYAWSYDLMDTARYYLMFDRLMTFWRETFPGRVLELSYEGLIADQGNNTRRLIQHCGLQWNDACLRFHENDKAVATPSAQQVRQPLNANSVGRWKSYEATFTEVRRFFQMNGIIVD